MYKSYKTEIKPTKDQIKTINMTIGTCRYVYNLYLRESKSFYQNNGSFYSGFNFEKWLNNTYCKNEEFAWIKESASKAIKKSIMNGEMSYRRFFNKTSSFPVFKKKNDYGSYYLSGTIHIKRHYIQLPKLGKVKLKEKGYIPFCGVKSATVSRQGDRYFVSVLFKENPKTVQKSIQSDGIGIDMGIKEFLFDSNGDSIANFSKSNSIIKLTKSLKRQQRKLSRRVKGSENFKKQKVIVQRLHRRIKNLKTDLKRKTVLEIVRRNPQFITIENLDIKGLMKNRKLSNAFHQIGIGGFLSLLKFKCLEHGIELRRVDRFYPSSQICSSCGRRKKMPLHIRVYNCNNCGSSLDRDLNAAINLKNAKDYTVLV